MPQHRVDDVAHRQHDTSQLDELLAQPVGAHLDRVVRARLVEEQVLEVLDRVVELLDRLEVPVDHGVEQPVHERSDAEVEQLGVVVPPVEHLRPCRTSSLPRTVMMPLGSTNAEIRRAQAGLRPQGLGVVGARAGAAGLEPCGVDGDEGVLGVPGRLGSLAGGDGVLDGVRVEPELRGQGAQPGVVRLAQVDPDERVLTLEELGHVLEGEALVDDLAVLPPAGGDASGCVVAHSPSLSVDLPRE